MRVLVDANRKLSIPLDNPQNRVFGDQLLLFDNFGGVNQTNFSDFKSLLLSLWNDSGIRTAFDRR